MASLPFREGTPAPRMATEDEQMVALNQKLKALGIEQTIRLPQICVIGDQSTGKSSLIEALSMVNVPRDTGCCTRCPLEVNLIKADDAQPWSCNVSLLKRYEFRRASTAKGAKSRTTDSWEELAQPDSTRFAQTDIKEDVCNLIRRAQAATLSPGIDAATFISGPLKREYLVNFSPNAVHLDIVQHELPSLSFVDLPGIVTRQDEGRHLVELVDALSTKYANNERSINLLTLSMMADFDTSKALSIILELKAESRTLAVMTKADLIRKEDPIDDFLKLLKGTAGPKMKYGYHAVMMDPDSSLSHAAAIQREGNFFDEDKRWAGLAISDQKKLGTVKLSETLSVLLKEATRHTLPSSLQLIEDRLEVVQKKLQQLPAPPGLEQMSIALTALINEFGDKMIKLFEGGGNADEFLLKSRWDRLAEAFRVTLLNSRPKLQLGTKMESAQKLKAERSLSESVELSDEDTQSPAPKSERKVTGPRAKSISTFHSFQLEEIRETNQRHGTTGLGPQMFPGARQAMMKKSLHRLDSMSQDFLEATFKLIKEHVSKHSKNVFRGYEGMALLPAATEHINAFVEACCNEQHDRSMALCKTEKTKPYTLDSATSAKEARRYLHILQTSRADFRLKLEKAVHDAAHAGKVRKGPEFKKKVDDLADDEWDTEIELLAHVRAYHQIAASRYADNVCQDVYACTFPKLAYEMVESLAEFLGPMRPEQHDKMVAWMSEDPGRELERNRLVKERESLLEARMLVQAALAKDAKGGKRKDRGEADVEMGGTPTESEEGGDESPLKKTKYREGLQASVEDEMDEE